MLKPSVMNVKPSLLRFLIVSVLNLRQIFIHKRSALQVFFVIRLQPKPAEVEPLPDIKDPDPLMSNELMDGRDPLLTMARDKHLEFSSLRRAKFSTMALLHELHMQAKDNFIYTCNNCKANVETRYHCLVCEVSYFAANAWFSMYSGVCFIT